MSGMKPPDYCAAVGELLLVVVLAAEGSLAVIELRARRDDRNQENLVNLMARVTEHNWAVIADPSRRGVLDKLRDFHTGPSENDRTEYWAARAVHLSHVWLLSQLWQLSDGSENLAGQDGWVRFAARCSKTMSNAKSYPEGTPHDWAASDLWRDLKGGREPHATGFIEWLQQRANEPGETVSG